MPTADPPTVAEAGAARTAAARPSARDRLGVVTGEAGRFGVVGLTVALVVLFSALRPDTFATVDNYTQILNGQTVVVLLALGSMVPLIVGEFDLSVGSVLTLAQILTVGFVANEGLDPFVAIPLALLCAAAAGLLNALLIVKAQVHAFVATLAVGSLCTGVGIWYTKGETLFEDVPERFTDLARADPYGIPLPVVYVAVVATALWAVLSFATAGRRLYAVGGNRRAAELTGIETGRHVTAAFVTSAVFAGLGGVILGAQLGSATASTGNDLLLPAIAGAFLGATTIRPGRFNVIGTVVAVYALSVAISGLQQMGAPPWVQPVFNGAVLAVAVALSGFAVRARSRRARARQLALLHRDT